MQASYIHVHSLRIGSGEEVLVCRVLKDDGSAGYGFSFRLEATEARHMAECSVGLRKERPHISPVRGHPWETAWVAREAVPWDCEPGFSQLKWLP
jgi:hypothetical protein